jgi:hypothetical protein
MGNLSERERSVLDLERWLGHHLAILKRKYSTDGTYRYWGYAQPLTDQYTSEWLILRETVLSGDITHVKAYGLEFKSKWSDRASLVYDDT